MHRCSHEDSFTQLSAPHNFEGGWSMHSHQYLHRDPVTQPPTSHNSGGGWSLQMHQCLHRDPVTQPPTPHNPRGGCTHISTCTEILSFNHLHHTVLKAGGACIHITICTVVPFLVLIYCLINKYYGFISLFSGYLEFVSVLCTAVFTVFSQPMSCECLMYNSLGCC